MIDIDGVRVEFGDGWGLARASNTQAGDRGPLRGADARAARGDSRAVHGAAESQLGVGMETATH